MNKKDLFKVTIVGVVIFGVTHGLSLLRDKIIIPYLDYLPRLYSYTVCLLVILIITGFLYGTYLRYSKGKIYLGNRKAVIGSIAFCAVIVLLYYIGSNTIGKINYREKILMFILFLSVGFTEEITYRGILFDYYLGKMPAIWATITSSIIFGCMHLLSIQIGISGVIFVSFLGILFCLLYLRYGLLCAVFCHAFFNSMDMNIQTTIQRFLFVAFVVLGIIIIIVSENKTNDHRASPSRRSAR